METIKVQTEPAIQTAKPKSDMKAAALKAWTTRRANAAKTEVKIETPKTEQVKVEKPAKAERKPRKARAVKKAKE